MTKYLLTINGIIPLDTPSQETFFITDLSFKLLSENQSVRRKFLSELGLDKVVIARLGVPVNGNTDVYAQSSDEYGVNILSDEDIKILTGEEV